MAGDSVVSLADRLKHRREELGISQAQAARELDVARTAYRLWEMEAAKPAPDRWRLISRWLGVSVTTMLLAEDLLSHEEAAVGDLAARDFSRSGRDWDAVGAAKEGDFFSQARALVEDAAGAGEITPEQAAALSFTFQRIESEVASTQTGGWETAELLKSFAADERAPRSAREALSVLADDLPEPLVETARLLVSELVTNSVVHGPSTAGETVGLYVSVERNRLRVEVSDRSPTGARPRTPSDEGGYGLTVVAELASRWGAGREADLNVTWFELDLPTPGTA